MHIVETPRAADKVREMEALKPIAPVHSAATPRATAETFGEGEELERSGTIYMPITTEGVRDRLNSIASHFGNGTRILLAIDVDKTLIVDGSDFKSQSECGNFSKMQVIDRQLTEAICRLCENSHLPDHPAIKAVALTAAPTWSLRVPEGDLSDLPYIDLFPELMIVQPSFNLQPRSIIRSHAMAELVPSFVKSFGPNTYILDPILSTDEGIIKETAIPRVHAFPLGPTLQQDTRFQNFRISRYTSPNGIRHDFLIQNPLTNRYRKILAWPVYAYGTIFVNYLIPGNGKEKGGALLSFLELMVPRDQWPRVVIAIDDNLAMLENIRAACMRMGIIFIGILYRPTDVAI
jgi:hypothetical protein